jgi:hypothetical protein
VTALRAVLGFALGVIARLWLATLRVRLEIDPALDASGDRPWVLVFFHGTQFPLLAWRRRNKTLVMVSLSNDGAMQARALRRVGLEIVRGSSSNGGARGLATLVRRMRGEGLDAAFAVDGPRGPYGVPKPGAVLAARRADAVLVPIGSAISRGWVLSKAWDRFALPRPFSEVAVVLGGPLEPRGSSEDLRVEVGRAIEGANARARTILPVASPEDDNLAALSAGRAP